MYNVNASETELIKELIRELNEFNSYMRSGGGPFGRDYINYIKGNYFYAFNPEVKMDKEEYKRNIFLMKTITDILNENCINIKSHGYTFLKDAICIVTDMESIDISLTKDVYPYIAEKYTSRNISKVEHSIRNALDAAYATVKQYYPERDCIMNSFEKKPTAKKFLLRAVQEMEERFFKEVCA